MKLSKKIIASLLLGIIIMSNINLESINAFSSTKQTYNNSQIEENDTLKIKNILEDENLIGIKK
nr:hypothetical protein [uncultured Romboutsia sp.]